MRFRDYVENALFLHNTFGKVYFPVTTSVMDRLLNHPFTQEMVVGEYQMSGTVPRSKADVVRKRSEKVWDIVTTGGWVQEGMNTFELTDDLVTLFVNTSVPRDIAEQTRPPFRAQMLKLPPGWLESEGKPINLVMVACFPIEDPEDSRVVWRVMGFRSDGVQIFSGWRVGAPLISEGLELHEKPVAETLMTLALNFSVWFNHTQAVKTRKPTPKSQMKRKRAGKLPTVWRFKDAPILDPNLVKATKEAYRAGKRERRLIMQHIVRGHYKQQRFGPGRKESKLIWVEPYWRGPETDEAWARVYRKKNDE